MAHTVYLRVEDAVYNELDRIAKHEDRKISYVAARILRGSLPNSKPAKERGN